MKRENDNFVINYQSEERKAAASAAVIRGIDHKSQSGEQEEISIEENPQCSLQGGVVLAMDVLGCCPAEAFEAETKGIIVPLAEHTGHYREKYQRYLEIYRSAQ